MRIFLASTHSGSTMLSRKKMISIGKPKYILETFFNGERKCLESLNDVGVENFLLDSGAFSFMSGAECTKETLWNYGKKYADFIKNNNIKYYFELDVDTIFGIEFVEDIRKMLEDKTGISSIPVWHKGRGVEYFKKMVAEYKYIAIGGLVFHVKKSELPLIKKMVDYAYSKGVKVHGLGFTKTKELEKWKWYSVDSASWTKSAALGHEMYDFNGHSLTRHRVEGNGYKIKISDLVLHNGIEWCKFQKYMDLKRW